MEHESWLYKNPKALASVMRGLEQARAGQVSKSPPDLDADQALADEDHQEAVDAAGNRAFSQYDELLRRLTD